MSLFKTPPSDMPTVELVRTNSPDRYCMHIKGEVIPLGNDPEHAAARYFKDLGHTGPLGFTVNGKLRTWFTNLVKAAEYTVRHTEARGLVRRKYAPWVQQAAWAH